MLYLLLACSKSTAPAPTAAPSTPEPVQAAPAWVGRWTAAPCGERSYVRNLALDEDGSVRLEERVSPCPAGAQCITSGVYLVEGTWKAEGGRATLSLSTQAPVPLADLPTSLQWDGAPVQGDCRYAPGWDG